MPRCVMCGHNEELHQGLHSGTTFLWWGKCLLIGCTCEKYAKDNLDYVEWVAQQRKLI